MRAVYDLLEIDRIVADLVGGPCDLAPFFVAFNFSGVTSTARSFSVVRLQQNCDFVLTGLSLYGASSSSETLHFSLSDQGSSESLFSVDLIPGITLLTDFFGTAPRLGWNDLSLPRLIPGGSTLLATAQATAGSPGSLQVLAHGVQVYQFGEFA